MASCDHIIEGTVDLLGGNLSTYVITLVSFMRRGMVDVEVHVSILSSDITLPHDQRDMGVPQPKPPP